MKYKLYPLTDSDKKDNDIFWGFGCTKKYKLPCYVDFELVEGTISTNDINQLEYLLEYSKKRKYQIGIYRGEWK